MMVTLTKVVSSMNWVLVTLCAVWVGSKSI